MYLTSLLDKQLAKKKPLDAEDLYKLNEAVFNLPEEDAVSAQTSALLFKGVKKAVTAYTNMKYDTTEVAYYYDYIALLSTMQNQHFFSNAQNKQLQGWLVEALGPAPVKTASKASKASASASASSALVSGSATARTPPSSARWRLAEGSCSPSGTSSAPKSASSLSWAALSTAFAWPS
mmetsp:Transcript_43287/g.94296  ORF Transcript_43287/g.94296 Transcript_43287/m.94296 type:complete len:178 (-) Transcript_43287:640-1173(-)